MVWPWQRKEKLAERKPELAPLSDRQYERLFLALLDDVAEGKSLEQLQKRLGGRKKDRYFFTWLKRFEKSRNPVRSAALARRTVTLAQFDLGELSILLRELGNQKEQPPEKEILPIDVSESKSLKRAGNACISEAEASLIMLYVRQACELSERNDFWGVVIACDSILNIRPDEYEVLYNKAIALTQLEQYEKAVATYNQAIHFNPNYPEALNNKGAVLQKVGRYEEAISAFNRAITFRPDFHEAFYNKGLSLSRSGRHEQAIVAYDSAIAIKSDKQEALCDKGETVQNFV